MKQRATPMLVAICACTLAILAGSAFAFFTSNGGSGNAQAAVASLAEPTINTATAGTGGTVELKWSTVTPPSSGTVKYYVTRGTGAPAGSCPTVSEPKASITSCTDSGLGPGTYEYKVTALWSSWSRTSVVKTATVTVGVVSKFTIASDNASPATGAAVSLTITAVDSAGKTVTNFTGSHSLTFSGASSSPSGASPTVENSSGTPVAFGTATALNFTAGVATVTEGKNGEMTLYKSGETSITATEGSLTTPVPLVENVVAAAKSFTLSASSTTPNTGVAVSLTIKAYDAYGNLSTTYTGSHSLTFAGAANSPSGAAPTVANSSGTPVAFGTATALNFSAGVATVTEGKNGEMTLYKSGEASITATEGTVTTPVALAMNVAAPARNFVLSASSTTPNTGVAVNLTITVNDGYGNAATTYTGSHNLIFAGAASSPSGKAPTVENSSGTAVAFGTATALNFIAGVANVTEGKNGEMTLYKSGEASITATEGTVTTPTALTMSVVAPAKSFTLSASSTTPTAGGTVSLTIKAYDAYGNLSTTYTGSHSLTFSGAANSPSGSAPTVVDSTGAADTFGTATPITFTAGVASVAESKNGVMTLYKSGEASIAATDGTVTTPTALTMNVAAATAKTFVITAVTTTPTAGVHDGLTIKANDTYGNLATSYTGTKSLVFTGPAASPSGSAATVENASGSQIAMNSTTTITFKEGVADASEAGAGAELTVYKSGAATLTAKEGSTVTTPTGLALTVNSATAASLTTTASTSSNVPTSTAINLTETAKDAYGNTATTYTGEKKLTYTASGTASEASPNGTAPWVINAAGTQVAFGTSTGITFTSGVASVASSKNGVLRLTKPGSANLTVSDGTLTAPALAITTVIGAGKVAFTSLTVTAGTVASGCYFACTVTGLGNSGTITSKITIADEFANVLQNVGGSKSVTITGPSGWTVTGSPVALPETGAATTTATFTVKSAASGTFTNAVTTATSTGYANGTITASK